MASGTVNTPPAISLQPQFYQTSDSHPLGLHENEFYRRDFGYKVQEQPLNTKRPMRMIIVGAGAAGLQVAYKAERQLQNVTWQIYEKNNDIGGTWLENRYPGCCCDIPSHSYQYQFFRNPNWSSYYSGAEEIWRYIKKFAVDNDLEKYVKLRHTVTEARWSDDGGYWEVHITRPDGIEVVDRAEILASCHGSLNSWKYPNIPGVESFKGKLMHSANWDNDYDLTNKTVAVIGGGSSAVQIIPSIQSRVKKLIPYLRSPVWITAGFGAKYAAPGGVNFEYSEEQRETFRQDPGAFDQYCRDVEGELNKRFTLMHLDSIDQKLSREYVKNDMTAKLGDDPHLINHLIPDFALGCRRMTPGTQYLQSLRKENVQVLTEGAVAFTEYGIIGESGTETKVDVIVCATGFNVTLPRYKIYGKNGRTLNQEWGDFPKAYLSIMAGSMPNLYYFIGPNGPGSHGSVLPAFEWLTRYMFKTITHMQRTSIKCMYPSSSAVAEFATHTHELLKRTAWSSKCRSWFKNGHIHGPVIAVWPGSRLHWFEALKEPRYEDMIIEYLGNNRFEYLGNGYTTTELDPKGNAVWYFDALEKELKMGIGAFDVLA